MYDVKKFIFDDLSNADGWDQAMINLICKSK